MLCDEGLHVRRSFGDSLMATEATFVCFLERGHDGYHRDPAWGIWEMPDDLHEED